MDVIIIGAGAAGLAAAERLIQCGAEVCILEACERVGGRIMTANSGLPETPFQLGAEFIHGKNNILWDLLRRAGLRAVAAGRRQWIFDDAGLRPEKNEFSEAVGWLDSAKLKGPDLTLENYLKGKAIPHEWLLRQYVEGFYAADRRRVSMQWLIASQTGDEETFRIKGGYGRLVEWLRDQVASGGASIFLNTVVDTIRWHKDKVDLAAQTPQGQRSFRAGKALVTVPLGVLKAQPGTLGAIRFAPGLPSSRAAAAAGLEMGNVVKVQLRFGEAFWSPMVGNGDFGFIHSRRGVFHTWWPSGDAPILTGWTGGGMPGGAGDLIESALQELADIFKRKPGELRAMLRDWRFHNWQADPFSHGSYSYTTAGHSGAPAKLARPLGGTLFFAGEALAGGAPQGTVHGAMESGLNAAEQILSTLQVAHR